VRSPQNPAGRLLLDKTYDVYGITETQARSWSFLLVAETNEMVWIDMEYCLFSEPTPYIPTAVKAYIPTPVKEEPVETVAPIETKRKSKKVEETEESIGHS
jgi:hypothetical protein